MTVHLDVDEALAGKLMLPVVEVYLAQLQKRAEKKVREKRSNAIIHAGKPAVLRKIARKWDNQRPYRSFRSLDEQFLEDYFLDDLDHISPNSRRVYRSWVRTFIKWGQKRGVKNGQGLFPLHIEDFDGGDCTTKPTKAPLWLPGSFFRDLYESQTWYFRGVFAFLTHSLCRQGELIRLKVGDLDLDHNRVNLIRPKTNDNDDRLPVIAELQYEMRRYLLAYSNAIGQPLSPDMYLFPRFRRNGPHARESVYPYTQRDNLSWTCHEKIVAALPPHDRANPEKTKGLGAHAIRRAMARHLYDRRSKRYEDYDALRQVQGMLGHTDVTITQRYIGMDSVRESRDLAIDSMTMFDDEATVVAFPGSKVG